MIDDDHVEAFERAGKRAMKAIARVFVDPRLQQRRDGRILCASREPGRARHAPRVRTVAQPGKDVGQIQAEGGVRIDVQDVHEAGECSK